MHFSLLDIVLGLPLIWAIYQGWIKGFILQLATLAGLFIGLWGAGKLSNYLGPILKANYGYTSDYTHITLYAICLIVIIILVYILGMILTNFIKIVALGIPNRIAGIVFSLIKYWILISFIVFYIEKTNNQLLYMDSTLTQKSFFYSPMLHTSQWLYNHLNK